MSIFIPSPLVPLFPRFPIVPGFRRLISTPRQMIPSLTTPGKRLCCILLSVLFYLSSAGQLYGLELTAQERQFIATHAPIRVHNETDWPPFNFYENGMPQGISIDVMNRIANITGLRIKYVSGPSWTEFVAMIKDAQLDVMLNIVDLPERRPLFGFTSSYVKSLSGVYVHEKNKGLYHGLDDLDGKTIAIPAGFDLEITLPQYHPKIHILPVRDILACIDAVNTGKADGFMEEIGVTNYILSQRVMPGISMAFLVTEKPFISDLRIGVRSTLPLVHSIIQKGLNEISGDELNKIRQKWLLKASKFYERNVINLTVPEKRYLHEHKLLKICVDPSWPPLDFIDGSGKHSGLSSDLIKTIAERLDLSLKLIPTNNWKDSLATIKKKGCDIIPLMNKTKESQGFLDFTRPYFDFATVIATRKDSSFIGDYFELYGKTLALQAHYFITEFVRTHHPEINIIEVENTRTALKLVSEHKAFATIDSLPAVVNIIETMALENIKIVGTVPQENSMKMGVRKGEPPLYSILDKGVASLTEREKVGLYKKWLDIEVEKQFVDRTLLIRIGVAVALFLLFLTWRHISLRMYAKRLKALNEKLNHYSTVDHLTQVLNRRSIEQRLKAEIERSKLIDAPLTLALLDIDHFKSINDTYGHLTGDEVLQKIAALITDGIRHNDHFGRWGGEEFLIILPDTSASGGGQLVEKLRRTIEAYDFGIEKSVTASFGYAQFTSNEKMESFISRVDNGLYSAKELGRNAIIHAQ
ncbi:transporter substrate-binding domain-containing protein [Desulfobulbus rhabdoformis]|uniref:transporter substrate-binding domain-containing diguanylate cyclase n=1 Tax=Desulfobulbus rhabdoformis TaxID=34032 RepID=UPI00196232B6|nr:transporter substrate-binding domain-containing protein [Desulfobulbus rhabdoformis]MBM9613826.1 transporter substrate-binding domain-containing protein [Desulfobulbus rhabdoformis]